MSSDQDENDVVWQNAGTQEFEFTVEAGAPPAEDALFIDTDDHLEPETESDVLNWTRQPLIRKETLLTLGRQLSPLLIPLPFAALVFLFTLPATLQGPPEHPIPLVMGMLLLALAILQGTLLYFAGASDTLWLLYTVCGYALFIAGGVWAAFGLTPALTTLGVLALLGFIPMRRGIHPTKEGYVDIVESFGKYSHTLEAGPNLLMPWEKVTRRVNIQETTWTCGVQEVSISREQFVRLAATISYQIVPDDAHLAALKARDWESSFRVLFVGTLQSMVNELNPSDFVSWSQSLYMRANSENTSFNPAAATRWDLINEALKRRIEDQAANWGIQVNWVRIQDPTILPHAAGTQTVAMTNGFIPTSKPDPMLMQALIEPKRPEAPNAASQNAAPVSAPPVSRPPRVEVLVDAYNAVRQGTITDPATILEIAQRFEHLASDPTANKTIEFDARRAANTLRQRAQKYQGRSAN